MVPRGQLTRRYSATRSFAAAGLCTQGQGDAIQSPESRGKPPSQWRRMGTGPGRGSSGMVLKAGQGAQAEGSEALG